VIQLELAAHEAAANIMKHAYQGRPDQRIVAEGEVSPEGVSIRLYHWGEPFVPGPVRPPALGGLHESGYGLSIIAHSVDEVTYSRDEHGRNCICLVKKLSQEVKGGKKRWN
jgi:anti-sigma regulatory factor (Ser/Thr protein kinase)